MSNEESTIKTTTEERQKTNRASKGTQKETPKETPTKVERKTTTKDGKRIRKSPSGFTIVG